MSILARARRRRKRPRLILHAGTHKTGTTSVQQVLAKNREALREKGVHYPDAHSFVGGGHKAHHRFAYAWTGMQDGLIDSATRFLESLYDDVNDNETVILSSESIYRHVHGHDSWRSLSSDVDAYWDARRRYLHMLSQALSGFDVRVTLFLRRRDSFAESFYKELVTKNLMDITFDRWVEKSSLIFDYEQQVGLFKETFPGGQIVRYEDAVRDGLLATLLAPTNASISDSNFWTRRSPDARVVQWFRESKVGTHGQRAAFGSSEEARSLFNDYGRVSLWRSSEERDRFLSRWEGAYGGTFFPRPPGPVNPAILTNRDRHRIADAWSRWANGRVASSAESFPREHTASWRPDHGVAKQDESSN